MYMWGEKLATFSIDEADYRCIESIYWIPAQKRYRIRHEDVWYEELASISPMIFYWDHIPNRYSWYEQGYREHAKRDAYVYAHALLREGGDILIPPLLRLCAEYL